MPSSSQDACFRSKDRVPRAFASLIPHNGLSKHSGLPVPSAIGLFTPERLM